MPVPVEHLFILSAILFAIGTAGFFLRRNVIIVLMSIELMLNAANLAFLAASRMHTLEAGATEASLQGPLFAIFVIVVAAVEAAVGLALVIALYRNQQTVDLEQVTALKN
jgi:NADH:ubiquinone oxidoreductase subunit K